MARGKNKANRQRQKKELRAVSIKEIAPTRRLSDAVLERMLDPHMVDSLSDIGDRLAQLAGKLGAKTMKFAETTGFGSAVLSGDLALDIVAPIVDWRRECDRRGIQSAMVMSIVMDADSISKLMLVYKATRLQVRATIRAGLAVWSLYRGRCNAAEVVRLSQEIPKMRGRVPDQISQIAKRQ